MRVRRAESPAAQLRIAVLVMALILGVGVSGYHYIEGWSLLDSLYMTLITLTTIGFGEVAPLSPAGRVFTILLIVCGMSVVLIAARSATQLLIEGQVRKYLGRLKMERSVRKLKNHCILVGFGRTGEMICRELMAEGVPLVVIESDGERAQQVAPCGAPVVQGDATQDEVLEAAGITRAAQLITALDSPADSVLIVLTARGMNPGLRIVARANTRDEERKLRRAGADKVVLEHAIGGRQMVLAALRPAVVEFLDLELLKERYSVVMEAIRLHEGSELCDRTLKEVDLGRRFGLIVMGIIHQNGQVTFNPGPDTRLLAGDDLIVFGNTQQLQELECAAGCREERG
jgi:voltage-gated potassium channel